MSTKRSVLSIKDKQINISRLDKRESKASNYFARWWHKKPQHSRRETFSSRRNCWALFKETEQSDWGKGADTGTQITLVSCHEKSAPELKKAKDRLTVLDCMNDTGTHKLKPVLIGKSAKPRWFKNINMDALLLIYKSQRNAWMNSKILLNLPL